MPERTDAAVLGWTEDHLFGFLSQVGLLGTTAGEQADFLRALRQFPPANPTALYWQARVCLLRRIENIDTFDAIFDAWFGEGEFTVVPPVDGDDDDESTEAPNPSADGQMSAADVAEGSGARASLDEVAGTRMFAPTGPDARRMHSLLRRQWPQAIDTTRSRRWRRARNGARLDARAVGRAAGRTGGEVVYLKWRQRPWRPRRLLILIDVSGSMREHYEDLIRVAHAAVASTPRVEVFTVGTRLTRVTDALAAHEVDHALEQLAEVVDDVDGGTRLGDSLLEFLGHGHYLAHVRDAVVVVMSDGLERGDCTPLAAATERLSRLSHRLVWWSPLACDPAYQPITRGMTLVHPNLDRLDGVRDMASALTALEREVTA